MSNITQAADVTLSDSVATMAPMSTTTTNTASPAQVKFIASLFDSIRPKSDSPGVAEVIAPVHNLLVLAMAMHTDPAAARVNDAEITKRDASRVIDALKEAQAIVPSDVIKWKKEGNLWFIYGDASVLLAGDVVTVTSSKGEKDVIVDTVVRTDGSNAYATVVDDRKAKKEAQDAAAAEVEALVAAFHARMDTQHVGVLLPTLEDDAVNKVAFWFVGEKTVDLVLGGTGRTPVPTTVQKSVLLRLLQLSDDEIKAAMALYGLEMGTCGFCCKRLTNDLSRERGIGPVCWSKGSF